ncbi:MAG TPA: DNA-3-methyladenine glycosylase I [Acidobacteriota bacterium]|nr:DNA-3-methyladenine glycosylase I [Acidobacteriota bacterium]
MNGKEAERMSESGKSDRKRLTRCWGEGDTLLAAYHDLEWGVPLHDDGKMFEFLVLEGMQAGLSWNTILRKRENFRKAFHGFDAERVARYGEKDVARLLADAGIIRNRLKVRAAVENARRFLEVRAEFGSFDRYIWGFVNGKPVANRFRSLSELPARTSLSDRISADLKARGFRFVGSTIIYAHMQATGMVNDHIAGCFRYRELKKPTL